MPWYAYKRDGWGIAVDAVSQHDAAQHIKRNAPGATSQGEFRPSGSWSTNTAMTTTKRQDQIHQTLEREYEKWVRDGRPGDWWTPKEALNE